MYIPILRDTDPADAFPDVEEALLEPNGLLAAGGDLSVERLLYAYKNGIFPWFNHGEPVLWWSPDPRCILWPDSLHISHSLKKSLKNPAIRVTTNTEFAAVVKACATARRDGLGTWINQSMLDAYCRLHLQGHAQSIECWLDDELVGGLYGVVIGDVFFGESMFSKGRDASKIALVHLVKQRVYRLIDCQLPSDHLQSMGAKIMNRRDFILRLREYTS